MLYFFFIYRIFSNLFIYLFKKDDFHKKINNIQFEIYKFIYNKILIKINKIIRK